MRARLNPPRHPLGGCAEGRIERLRQAFALAAALLAAPASGFTLLGLTVGEASSTSKVTAVLDGARCGETHRPGAYVCRKFQAIAGHPTEIHILLGAQSKIERIQVHFESGGGEEVDRMLLSLYGTPATASNETISSRFGRRIVFVWRDVNDVEARYSRLTGLFGSAELVISTKQDRAVLLPKTVSPSVERGR